MRGHSIVSGGGRYVCAAVAVLATAGTAAAQGTTWSQCWSQFKSRLADCCQFAEGNIRNGCFDGAKIGLDSCLAGVETKPTNCWDEFTGALEDCENGGPGSCPTEVPCVAGAISFFSWCVEPADESGAGIRPELQWNEGGPPAVVSGQPYEFVLRVGSPRVTGVTFFLIHKTPLGKIKLFEVGKAKTVHNMLDMDTIFMWEFTTDTADWPILDDQRVVLLARTELDDKHGPIDVAHVEIVGIPGDFNRDGQLDALDFIEFQTAWQAGELRADMNGDGVLDILDFAEFSLIFETQ